MALVGLADLIAVACLLLLFPNPVWVGIVTWLAAMIALPAAWRFKRIAFLPALLAAFVLCWFWIRP